MLAHIALLIRFNRNPGLRVWTGLLVTGAFGWLAQPMLFPIALPLLLIYYLSAGVRHAFSLASGPFRRGGGSDRRQCPRG